MEVVDCPDIWRRKKEIRVKNNCTARKSTFEIALASTAMPTDVIHCVFYITLIRQLYILLYVRFNERWLLDGRKSEMLKKYLLTFVYIFAWITYYPLQSLLFELKWNGIIHLRWTGRFDHSLNNDVVYSAKKIAYNLFNKFYINI